MRKSLGSYSWVMKTIHEIVLFMHWQLMCPMNYNNAYYWVHLMCKELYMLWMIVSQTFQYSIQPNFFCPHNYPSNDSDQITNTELWLKRILLKFQCTEESDMCKGELLEFTETFRQECENKMICEAWPICGSNLKWHTNWPKLM